MDNFLKTSTAFIVLFLVNLSLSAQAKKSVIFDNFESGTYEKWTVEGTAFGDNPLKISDTPKYQGDLKAKGKYCVNSHASAEGDVSSRDKATGKLTSKEFTVSHDYITFLINGGSHKGKTCINLLVEGKKVASASGVNSSTMRPNIFNTKKFLGKKAQLEVVDNHSGGWGNIGIDEIVFTNKMPVVKKAPKRKRVGKKTMSRKTKVSTPEEQRQSFKLAEGFIIELVASEEQGVVNPIDLAFDDRGRLWTQTANMYPLDPVADIKWGDLLKLMKNPEAQRKDPNFKRVLDLYEGTTKGTDSILLIDKPHSKPAKAKVWADGLTIPQSILPYKNGVYVAQGSQLFYLEDSNNDGKADKRDLFLDGFGYTDSHTMSHTLERGPGGWIHFSHGALNMGEVTAVKSGVKRRVDYCKILKMSIDGKKFEVISAGLNNIWGFKLRDNGQWFGCEANDMGQSITPMEEGTGYKGIGNEKIRDYQPFFPAPNKFRVGGTGIAGLAFMEDTSGGFPDEYKNVAFLANPISSTINCVRIVRNADGSVTSEHLPDLLVSGDDWFRPINMQFGPDGCLYIIDWYNKIISHNELPRSHPERDKEHGRIWRIRHKSQKPREIVNFYKADASELIKHIDSPYTWHRRSATNQIIDRQVKELIPALKALTLDSTKVVQSRIAALWCLEGLGHFDLALFKKLTASSEGDLKREAVRALSTIPVSEKDFVSLLKPLITDKNAMVRSQVIRTVEEAGEANSEIIDLLVSFCHPAASSNNLGSTYEKNFERYLARKALEKYPLQLTKYLGTELVKNQPSENVSWAINALNFADREKAFLADWGKKENKVIDDSNFLQIALLLKSKNVVKAVKAAFESETNAQSVINLAMAYRTTVDTESLKSLVTPAVKYFADSDKESKVAKALQIIYDYKIAAMDKAAYKALEGSSDLHLPALKVLSLDIKKNNRAFEEYVGKAKNSPAKLYAVQLAASFDEEFAVKALKNILKEVKPDQQKAIINSFSMNKSSAGIVLKLLADGVINKEQLNYTSAEYLLSAKAKDTAAKELYAYHKAIYEKEKAERNKLISKFAKVAETHKGDLKAGKQMFDAICLSCHAVGGKGAGFAPPLDGSSHREMKALLTAIVSPDEAVESSYLMYRIVKKDGSALEGYREQKTDRGTTLVFMGGAKLFIPKSDIESEFYLPGRSVMPSGLINSFKDQQIADILAYIKSLK